MIKATTKIALALLVVGLLVSSAYAGPKVLSKAQMDSIAAGGVYKVSAFVCPVITQAGVGMHNPKAVELGGPGTTGTYTIGPPTGARGGNLMVPEHATNADGYGVPGDITGSNAQSQPGDTDYTAIWSHEATPDP